MRRARLLTLVLSSFHHVDCDRLRAVDSLNNHAKLLNSLTKQREVLHEDVDHEEVVLHLEKIPLKVRAAIPLNA